MENIRPGLRLPIKRSYKPFHPERYTEKPFAEEGTPSLRKKRNQLGNAIGVLGERIDEINQELERRKAKLLDPTRPPPVDCSKCSAFPALGEQGKRAIPTGD